VIPTVAGDGRRNHSDELAPRRSLGRGDGQAGTFSTDVRAGKEGWFGGKPLHGLGQEPQNPHQQQEEGEDNAHAYHH
jgi:hypothetical protein